MHASMVTLPTKDGELENLVAKYSQDLLPLLLATTGCEKSFIFADSKKNVVRLLALWRSEEYATSPEARSTFQTVVQGVMPYLAGDPQRELFEVRYGE